MSAKMGRPTDNKKTRRFDIRLTPDELDVIQDCSEKMGVTKTEVVKKGISLVKAELDAKK